MDMDYILTSWQQHDSLIYLFHNSEDPVFGFDDSLRGGLFDI